MAIALDDTTFINGSSGSHTCSGTSRVLIVFTDGATNVANSAVTYNGVSMTEVGTAADGATGAFIRAWILFNPATGANTISVSSPSSTLIFAASYTGCNATQPDASNTTTGNGTDVSGSVTTVADKSWVACMMAGTSSSFTPGTNFTVRESTGVSVVRRLGDTNAAVTPAGATTQAGTLGSSNNWVLRQVSIAPAPEVTISETVTCTETKTFTIDSTTLETITVTEDAEAEDRTLYNNVAKSSAPIWNNIDKT